MRSTTFADMDPLIDAGVSWEAITRAVPVHATIRVTGAVFRFDEDGRSAFVMPVRALNAITPEAPDPLDAVCNGAIVDLVAFHPARPDCWALRCDAAEWLGSIQPQYLDPEPVPIWRSPLGWLRGGCRGLTLLTHCRASQYRLLSGLGSIIAEDHRHAAQLRDVLSQPRSTPRVFVVQEARRAA